MLSPVFPAARTRVVFDTVFPSSSFAKDSLSYLQNNLVVYRFRCQCDADYIGRTDQRLETWIAHVRINVRQCTTFPIFGIARSTKHLRVCRWLIADYTNSLSVEGRRSLSVLFLNRRFVNPDFFLFIFTLFWFLPVFFAPFLIRILTINPISVVVPRFLLEFITLRILLIFYSRL